jgi:hypothetical protein
MPHATGIQRYDRFDISDRVAIADQADRTGNAYRNFNYLIACGETGDALAIDPLTTKSA